MTHLIGIVPTLDGAIAVLAPNGDIERLADLPVASDAGLSWIDGQGLYSLFIDSLFGRTARAIVERPESTDAAFGSVLAILQSRHIEFTLVAPDDWRRDLEIGPGTTYAEMIRTQCVISSSTRVERHSAAIALAHWGRTRTPIQSLTSKTDASEHGDINADR